MATAEPQAGATPARPRTSTRSVDLEPKGPAAYGAEFVGTFLLVMFVCFVVAINSQGGIGVTDFAVVGLAHVFVLAMLIHALGGTSGAHFNPAVTAALAVLRKISPADAAVYVLLQLAGAVLGALVAKTVLSEPSAAVANYGAVAPSGLLEGKVLGAFGVELIGTFTLMFAIMGLAVNPRAEKGWAGLIIGGTLGLCVFVFGPLSGAGLNPARAFGPNLVTGEFGGADVFLLGYVIGPVIGAILAALVYQGLVLSGRGLPGERPIDTLEEDPVEVRRTA